MCKFQQNVQPIFWDENLKTEYQGRVACTGNQLPCVLTVVVVERVINIGP